MSYANYNTKTQPKAKSQKPKPKAKSEEPKAKSKLKILAPKCNKKHANQRFWLKLKNNKRIQKKNNKKS